MIHSSPIRHLSDYARGSPFEAHDREFEAVLGSSPRLVQVVAADAHEGPVYVADEDALYFTTLPRPGKLPLPGVPVVAIKRLALDGGRFSLEPGRVSLVRGGAKAPNGLAFSPDEQVLYITDSGANQAPGSYHVGLPHHIMAFDVKDGRHLVGGRLFAVTTPGFPDGIKVDTEGRVYASAFSGVQVFDRAGEVIGAITLPGAVNFAFGGRERNTLFITTDEAVWAAILSAHGVPQPARSGQQKGA